MRINEGETVLTQIGEHVQRENKLLALLSDLGTKPSKMVISGPGYLTI